MSELYLQKFELLRNFGFFIFPLLAFAVAVVFMSLSSDISKIGFVAVIILGSFIGHSTCNVSLKENSCFSSE